MDKFYGALVVGAVAPLFWLLARSIVLFAVRFVSRDAEWWFTAPLSSVIARLASSSASAVMRLVRGGR